MKYVAVIDKYPTKVDYSKYFDFPHDVLHMVEERREKVLKKDVTLDFDPSLYDLVILVGKEAAKMYGGITSVTSMAGILVNDKYVAISNPAMLSFKPEGKQDFERSIQRVKAIYTGEQTGIANDYAGISTKNEAVDYLAQVLNSNALYVAMDTEGTALYPRDGYVIGISISYKPNQGRYISTDIIDQEVQDLIQQIIDRFIIVMHNMKYDCKMLEYHFGFVFRMSHIHDTMLLHYVLDENSSHSLKELAIKYTDMGDYDAELDSFKKHYCKTHGMLEEDFTYDLIPFEIMWPYASADTDATLRMVNKFLPVVEANPKLLWVYKNLLVRGTRFLQEMEEVGIPMSSERLALADGYVRKWIEEAKQEIWEFKEVHEYEKDSGSIFNPNSTVQLRKVLFDYCKLSSSGKRTGTGALSTDAEVLEELSEQHPLPSAILNVRQLGKIHSSYLTKILPELDKDGRIRTNFNLIFTTSGRLSSSGKFNAQQIPRDNPIIKGCIVAPDGYKIVSQDLQTGEMYYAAVLSGDTNLMSVFQTGGDFHSTIAKMVFNLPCAVEDVKKLYPDMRQSAKAISFGILYGSGAAKVSQSVSKATGKPYPIEQAQEDIDAYFTKFSKLKKWLKSRKEFIEANGFTYSFFGRKRRLLNVFSHDKGIASGEVRSGINAEVQSLCSDMNLLGAMDTHEELKAKNMKSKIFMLVHDSIVALVPDDELEAYKEILRRNTQKDRGCSIPGHPIGVDQDVGQDYSFGHFEEYYSVVNGELVKNV